MATDAVRGNFTKTQAPRRAWVALGQNLGAALASLRGNLFRSFLTILGVVIGVASVIILVAFGEGARSEITSQIDTLGTNVAIVVPGKLQHGTNFNPMGGLGVSNLALSDVERLKRHPMVQDLAPLTFMSGGVYRGKTAAAICMPIATTSSFLNIRRLNVDAGRFFTDDELDKPVCAIGLGIKKDLFPNDDPLGKTLNVAGADYKVIGVVKERNIGSGLFGGEELDAMIYVPIKRVHDITKTQQLHRILVEIPPDANPEKAVDQVKSVMLEAHGGRDDFSILRAKELLSMFYKVFVLLAALLLGITSISLIVGGIGIMNVMLVTVTERTREIGIRKTVGARRSDIFFQFLSEAVTLSMLGGLLGIALAFVACRLVQIWMPLEPVITAESILLGFSVCVAVGVISGVLPAIIAARKDPIEAIRHE